MTTVLTGIDGLALVGQSPSAACPCRCGQPDAPWYSLPSAALGTSDALTPTATPRGVHCLVCCRINSAQLHFRYLHITHAVKYLSVEFNIIFAVWKQEG